MFMDQRRQLILRRLARDGTVRVAELARELDLNPMTIRRDLADLEAKGQLRRVYGGALPVRREATGPWIGLMVPTTDSYYGPVVLGAERAACQLGARLVLATHFYLEELEHERLEKLVSLDLDALVLATRGFLPSQDAPAPTGSNRDDTISDQVVESIIDRMQCPVILVERRLPIRGTAGDPCVVRSAHDQGALLGVRHLQRLGHDRVLAVMRPTPTTVGLLHGLNQAREQLGIVVDTITLGDDPDLAEIAELCLTAGHRALFVHPDGIGVALVEELLARGVDIPGEMHVVSYDDVSATAGPIPLTAVAPAKEELGYEAVRMALHQIDGSTRTAIQNLALMPRLVIRDSAPACEPVPPSSPDAS